jgi:hypothetical protein
MKFSKNSVSKSSKLSRLEVIININTVKYQAQVKHELHAAQSILIPFLRQLDTSNPFAAATGSFDPMSGMGSMDPSMLNNIDPAAMEKFKNIMAMDPIMQGMDPSMLGFDPNMMQQMMGGNDSYPAIDPTLIEQVEEYSSDPEALKQRLSNMMIHH